MRKKGRQTGPRKRPKKIFISHSSEDMWTARQISKELEKLGVSLDDVPGIIRDIQTREINEIDRYYDEIAEPNDLPFQVGD